jgi:hypothetical protein
MRWRARRIHHGRPADRDGWRADCFGRPLAAITNNCHQGNPVGPQAIDPVRYQQSLDTLAQSFAILKMTPKFKSASKM